MPRQRVGAVELEYETHGDPAGPAVLLIMGLGAQLVRWPDAFCQALAGAGHHVVRFDNRDVGLSTQLSGRPNIFAALARSALGRPPRLPYTLHDMADDARGILDGLGIARAHVIGASMGGMIGQLVAARDPGRVRSLVSIMSSSGSLRLPGPRWDVRMLLVRRPSLPDREARIAHMSRILRRIGSQVHPEDPASLRTRVAREIDRCYHPPGYLRQLAAIVGSPSRLALLPRITAPTLVLHGAADPLVPVAAAHDLAARIPGADLEIVPDMGHDLPALLLPRVIERILAHLRRADAR